MPDARLFGGLRGVPALPDLDFDLARDGSLHIVDTISVFKGSFKGSLILQVCFDHINTQLLQCQSFFALWLTGETTDTPTLLEEMPYSEIQSALDDPPGYRNYWSAEHLPALPDNAVDVFCARAIDMIVPSPSQHVLFPWGGAVARQADGWPIANRDATWCVHPFGLWEDPDDDERGIAWAKAVRADMAPFAAGGAYLNFTADEGGERIVAGYGGPRNYQRLAAVKRQFDPDNTFRLNHNIKPAAG